MVSSFSEMGIQPPAYSFISRLIEPQRSSPNVQLSPAVRSRNSSPKADQLLSSGSQSLSPIEMDSFFSGMSSFVQLPVCSPGSQLVQTPNSSPIAQLSSSVRSHNSSPNADQLFTSGSQRSSPPSMNPSSSEMKVPNLFAQSPFYPSVLYAILGDPPAYSESRQCTQVDERSTYAVLETYQPHQTYHELQGSRSFPATDALSCLNSLNSEQFYTSVLDSYQAQYPPAREDGGQFRLGQDGIGSAGSSINSSPMIDHEQYSGEGNSQLVQAPSTSPNAHVQLSPVVRSPNSSPNADQLLVSGCQSLSTSGMVSSFSEMGIQPPAYSFISRLIEPQRSSPNAQLSPAVRSRNSSPKAEQLLSSGSQSLSPIEMDSFFSGMSSFVQLPVCSPGSQLVQTPNSSPIAQLSSSVRSHNSSPNADQLFTSGSQRSSPPSMNPSSSEMKVPNLFAQSPFYPSVLYAILGDPPAYSESRQCTQVDERSTYAVLETYQPHQTYHELQGSRSFPATDALSCLNSLNSEQFYTSVLDSYQAQYPPAREDGGQFRLGQDGIGSAGSSINSSPMIDHEQNSGGIHILLDEIF
ncbi:hypothetical protein TNCT_640151 [Trichonephila clavata]|uniref:Uncharacterized protein n=1 Tax=Trichonephila clavata TaxID=2740835 RepID=A0A8X6L8N6_TRICU|nr:hypothetical protein TNCT_640151 [Trichonephila clavata]